ncbi:MAG: anaerobic ribonucleoside-triphosphate reductase activating protein [Clostridia bacterium]|nr:anaerobic ribonucleoside-triphosphate reductase activating protein [Clostridia bacterium]MBQ7752018.1 anaerobic ribonucleoside-triphosphate reductase activating protein [Clostridia bacterium]
MKIHGLQKLTLLDYPEKTACTVFTGGCNFRCPFCHNALLVTDIDSSQTYSEEEILDFLSKRTGLLDGVCITGGEPLMNGDIADFIKKIKEMGYSVKLDTNGTFPERLKTLLENNLIDYVAMDIKNSKYKYAITAGIKNVNISDIERSINLLKSSDIDYEFRTTVVNEFHTESDILKIAEWIKGAKKYFLQNFEDSGNLIGENLTAVSKEVLESMKSAAKAFVENTQIRGV